MNDYLPRQDARRPLDWVNCAFLIGTPLVAVLGTAWYSFHYGVTRLDVANFAVMFVLTSICVTGGYHRMYSHKSYEGSKLVQLFYLVFGAAAVENSLLNWASDHRYHHRYVDQNEDPYNILKGGLYAHMGWIFYKDTRDHNRRFENVPDLLKDPLVMWQHRWYLPLVVLFTFALPTYIGLLGGRPVGGLLWGGFLRVVLVHHTTFFINSLAHLYGSRPYDTKGTARDSWWLAPLTFGEGYHNFHHKFQADYRNGIKWWQFDSTKWFINLLAWTGQARKLKRTPEPLIVKARLAVEKELLARKVVEANLPERMWKKISWRLDDASKRLELAHERYLHAKAEYRHRRDEWTADVRRQWDEKLAACRAEYREATDRWQAMMRAMNRLSQPSAQGLLTLTAVMDVLKHRLF
ncbi:MAG TPA: fatty acid desaturase [Elusimicrobiota bacterium]|nr:fatty acid desaturase [Elusimicrobiota bacterium]